MQPLERWVALSRPLCVDRGGVGMRWSTVPTFGVDRWTSQVLQAIPLVMKPLDKYQFLALVLTSPLEK